MTLTGHYVVVGDNPLAYRVVRALATRFEAAVMVLVLDDRTRYAHDLAALDGVEVRRVDRVEQPALEAAGVAEADGVALLWQDDGANVAAALLLRDEWPHVPVVVRVFDEVLGQRLAEGDDLCTVLSSSQKSAPEVVAEALGLHVPLPIPTARYVSVSEDVRLPPVMTLFAVDAAGNVHMLPAEAAPGVPADPDLVPKRLLARAAPEQLLAEHPKDTEPDQDEGAPRPRHSAREFLGTLVATSGRRLVVSGGVLLGIVVLGAAVLWLARGATHGVPGFLEALYEAALPAFAGSDPEPGEPSPWVKGTQVVLTLVSVAVVPWVTAVVVDGVLRTQVHLDRGTPLHRRAGHVVVVGLSDLGTRIVRSLDARGIGVVAVDADENARGVAVARSRDVDVVIGDARRATTLRQAYVDSARAVVIVTSGTANTASIGFAARTLARADDAPPHLRIVLRAFDRDQARLIRKKLDPEHTVGISSSFLAAPWFLAALMGQQVKATVPFLGRSLLLVEHHVTAQSPVHNHSTRTLHAPGEYRLVAVRTRPAGGGGGNHLIEPSQARPLQPGDVAYVLTTRRGLKRLGLLNDLPGPLIPRPQPVR